MLLTKELLKAGYAPAVVPKDKKAEYIGYLADQDIKALSHMIKSLSEYEEQRMNEFGIILKKKINIQEKDQSEDISDDMII